MSFSHTFGSAGSFAYHCTIHPWMGGTVTVVAAAAQQPVSPAAAVTPAMKGTPQLPNTSTSPDDFGPLLGLAAAALVLGLLGLIRLGRSRLSSS